ncbi:hypothetical protein M758_9G124000 [Ceratodon purpureus]|uniref:Uncharacterized protein n=1 Tax=Ceratodon purpureus TaxID=3225 RepID=A0A8T0GV31_CERPU|nr:hypothetical protein KC19_9G109100 [Ceratodon purpureus]KAG0606228.1 hypothetical protein M758_9G124000 [Ceratodon purpureus]
MVRPGNVLNKGAAPRSTRYFGRQFYDPRDVPEPPKTAGFLRAHLSYRYPRPWKCQDPEVWRYPDHILPTPYPKGEHPGHDLIFTRLCYRRDHVDKISEGLVKAHPHLVTGKKSGKP